MSRRYLVPTIIGVVAIFTTGIFMLLVPSGIIPSKMALILEALFAILALAMVIVIVRIGIDEQRKEKEREALSPTQPVYTGGKTRSKLLFFSGLLGFFGLSGLGHFYLGHPVRAIIYLSLGLAIIIISIVTDFDRIAGFYPPLYFLQLADATNIAKKMGVR